MYIVRTSADSAGAQAHLPHVGDSGGAAAPAPLRLRGAWERHQWGGLRGAAALLQQFPGGVPEAGQGLRWLQAAPAGSGPSACCQP